MMQDLFCDLRECHPFKLARPVGAGSAKVRCTRWINVKEQLQNFSGEKKCEQLLSPPLLIFLDHLSSVLYIGDSFKVAKDVETSFWHGLQGQGRQKYQLWMYFSEWVLSPFVNHNGRLLPIKIQSICWARPRCVWNITQHAYCWSASVRTDLGQVVY